MDVRIRREVMPSWYGELVGHYEGDTLSSTPSAQNDRDIVYPYPTRTATRLHVIERWRMTNEGKGLEASLHRR